MFSSSEGFSNLATDKGVHVVDFIEVNKASKLITNVRTRNHFIGSNFKNKALVSWMYLLRVYKSPG